MPNNTSHKVKALLLLVFSAVAMVVGADYAFAYFGGDVPEWAFYVVAVLGVAMLGYSYAVFIEAFGKKK